ncbi:MAG: sulfatase [Verrucomicrobiales bacterium]
MNVKSPLAFSALALFFSTAASADTKNVVIFFVDDLGWTDLGCYGSDLYETPHIDALAADGVKFTSAYAACTVCSPSRAALMTGQYPARLNLTDFIPGHPFENTPLEIPDWTQVLEHRHLTIPEILKPHGYVSAHLGKWHLARRDRAGAGGGDSPDPENHPDAHGFDVNIGGNERGAPGSYFWPYGRGKTLEAKKDNSLFRTLPPDDTPDEEREGEYLTDRLAAEAEALLDRYKEDGTPFFMNFSFYNVHTPLMGRPDLVEKYQAKLEENPDRQHTNPHYAAMVESVDEAVGRVVAKLKETGAWDETLVVFSSDNGGLDPQATDNDPIRQGKGSSYEGGVRVPTIVRLPEADTSGSLCHKPIITVDFLPTILDALGLEAPGDAAAVLDGVSLLPVLFDPRADLGRDDLFWHYPHYHSGGAQPHSAIRSDNWKLIEHHGQGAPELYDLSSDIHENRDIAASRPEIAKELHARLEDWRDSMDAQMPVPNENFNPDEPTGIRRGDRFQVPAPLRE